MRQKLIFVISITLVVGLNFRAHGVELLTNGDFSNGSANWHLDQFSGASASLTPLPTGGPDGDSALRITIMHAGTQNWHIQFMQTGLAITKGESYTISFYARSVNGLKPSVAIQQHHNPWAAISSWYSPAITTQWQFYTYEFTATSTNNNVRLIVGNLGLNLGTIDLARVSVATPDSGDSGDESEPAIHVNQLGYLPSAEKRAVIVNIDGEFNLVRDAGNQVVHSGSTVFVKDDRVISGDRVYHADFSSVTTPGIYRIECDGITSPSFAIDWDVYREVADALLKSLYFQRCGLELDPLYAGLWSHAICHNFLGRLYVDETTAGAYKDGRGGWHDAGDYNRYTTPAAVALGHLLLLREMYPSAYGDNLNIPETENGFSDLLDEIRWGLKWIVKMQDASDGGVYHHLTKGWYAAFIMPEFDKGKILFYPKSSHATGGLAAVCAWGARLFAPIDPAFANQLRSAAEHAWRWLVTTPGPDRVDHGYGDWSYLDEQYWAAVQLYALTGEIQYHNFIKNRHEAAPKGYGWQSVGTLGDVGYLLLPLAMQDETLKNVLGERLTERATSVLYRRNADAYRIGLVVSDYGWGSNMAVGAKAMDLLVENYFNPSADWVAAAYDHLHYLLGRNAVGTSYVSGYGTLAMRFPHHRPSDADGVDDSVPGLVSGGPNRDPVDSAADLVAGNPPAKSWVDVVESYSMNEITTYWNSPFIFAFGAIEALAEQQKD
ncbi:glycoside hydrolase family 9 protein [Planctomycetota bacterium]